VTVLRRAADISIALNHHLFDALYHAVALQEGATLVTADTAYFGKAKDLGSVELLADFAM
jgi:predicted nucleic acid-binding protein